mmetsp:Transcript_3147/g.4296  ORF Transcript_3147/g.4296 Transcript_3147/m.4296 type:complete len:89 (+) Transcript_3147:357-623(+)
MCYTWIEFGDHKARFTFMLIANNVTWDWEPLFHDSQSISLRSDQQISEVFVVLVVLVLLLTPHRNLLTVEDDDMEESIQKKDSVCVHT